MTVADAVLADDLRHVHHLDPRHNTHCHRLLESGAIAILPKHTLVTNFIEAEFAAGVIVFAAGVIGSPLAS